MLISIIVCCCWVTFGCACMCTYPRLRDYCNKGIVFRGTPVAQEQHEDNAVDKQRYGRQPYRVYTVDIEEVFWVKDEFKGMKSMNLTTPAWDSLCGVDFSLDTSYVIAAGFSEGSFTTRLCDGNGRWDSFDKKEKRFFSSRIPRRCLKRKEKNRN